MVRVRLTSIAVLLAVGGVWMASALLPERRIASKTRIYRSDREAVFSVVTRIADGSWRRRIRDIRVIDSSPGKEVWVEIPHSGPELRFRTCSLQRPFRFEIEIIDNSNLGGRWIGEFEKLSEGGTRVHFTEEVITSGLIAKFLSRIFFDIEASIEEYLDDLGKKLGE